MENIGRVPTLNEAFNREVLRLLRFLVEGNTFENAKTLEMPALVKPEHGASWAIASQGRAEEAS